MQYKISSMKYPIFNIGYKVWDLVILGDFFIYDEIYKGDEDFFNTYYLDQIFIDCNGNTFKLIGKTPIKSFYNFFLSKRYKLNFEDRERRIELEELKELLTDRALQIKSDAARNEIYRQIKNSRSIEELLIGF